MPSGESPDNEHVELAPAAGSSTAAVYSTVGICHVTVILISRCQVGTVVATRLCCRAWCIEAVNCQDTSHNNQSRARLWSLADKNGSMTSTGRLSLLDMPANGPVEAFRTPRESALSLRPNLHACN